MCRTILFIALLFLPLGIFAQDESRFLVPDYSSINDMVTDPNSAFFYPHLLKRYKGNDSTLSPREYRMLYYGFAMQKEFVPFSGFTIEDENIRQIFSKDELDTSDLKKIVSQSKQYLDKFPFDLKKLNLVYVASRELGDSINTHIYLDKARNVAFAILSSGDGLSKQTAFHVISLPDEYAMIKMLGYEYSGGQELSGDNCNYLGILNNIDEIPGFYFNAKPVFNSIPQAMK